jgi:hypothetical protein
MTGFTVVADATHGNIGSLPAGIHAAGYVTGSGDVPWNAADWSAHPDAIRIDQTPADSPWDATADADDMERGAVRLDELAGRAKLRIASFRNGTRPGQRSPLVYASAVNITAVVNALISSGVTSGVGLWVANWNLTEPAAIADVTAAAGPFPIRGIQYVNTGPYDLSVMDTAWLANRSGQIPVTSTARSLPVPPGEWTDGAVVSGIGMDGHLWAATFNFGTGRWSSVGKVG